MLKLLKMKGVTDSPWTLEREIISWKIRDIKTTMILACSRLNKTLNFSIHSKKLNG